MLFCFKGFSPPLLKQEGLSPVHLPEKDIIPMHLIELFLPLYDSQGNRFPQKIFTDLKTELTETFGGLTIHSKAPATGLWKPENSEPVKDTIVIYEIMTEDIDQDYWSRRKEQLQNDLQQDEIMIRSTLIRLL